MADDISDSALGIIPNQDQQQQQRPANLPQGVIGDAIYKASIAHGLNPQVMGGIGSIESNFTPNANWNKPTQYKGLFQLGGDEWRHYGHGNIYNATDNANAAAALLADRAAEFKAQYGRDPTPAQLYMLHQQGPGFYSHGTMTNIVGNPYPGMRGAQTPASFESGWSNELNKRMGGTANSVLGPAAPPQLDPAMAAAAAGGPAPTPQTLPGAPPVGRGAPSPSQIGDPRGAPPPGNTLEGAQMAPDASNQDTQDRAAQIREAIAKAALAQQQVAPTPNGLLNTAMAQAQAQGIPYYQRKTDTKSRLAKVLPPGFQPPSV